MTGAELGIAVVVVILAALSIDWVWRRVGPWLFTVAVSLLALIAALLLFVLLYLGRR